MMNHGHKNSIVTGPLLDECDPFWIDAQAKVRTHVRQYVRRAGLDVGQHRMLLDILGIGSKR
jgi:hypothetical protein